MSTELSSTSEQGIDQTVDQDLVLEMRDRISSLEDVLRNAEQCEIEPVHYFADGVYAREITILKDTVLTGKIHLTQHLNIISKGKIQIATESGFKIIEAPYTMVSEPGTKRAGYALEDTVWTTIHVTDKTDIEEIEKETVVETYEEFLSLSSGKEKLSIGE